MNIKRFAIQLPFLLALVCTATTVTAQEAILEQMTAKDLFDLLVNEGVIDRSKMEQLRQRVNSRQNNLYQTNVETVDADKADQRSSSNAKSVVRIPHVPQYIKDEIERQVGVELREDLLQEITELMLFKAEQENWLIRVDRPSWTDKLSFYGDIRVRWQNDIFDDRNVVPVVEDGQVFEGYYDIDAINQRGSIISARRAGELLLQQNDRRERQRLRFRLGMKANVGQYRVGARLATGNEDDPVSTNVSLGDYGSGTNFNLDRAYIKYVSASERFNWKMGRFGNPFESTDLVWDSDLNFDGAYASINLWTDDGGRIDVRDQWLPSITIGAFPLQELKFSDNDKWLYGFQFALNKDTYAQNKWLLALSYYHYENIVGREFDTSAAAGVELDVRPILNARESAPEYMQLGNSLYDITNDGFDDGISSGQEIEELFALASDYREVNLTLQYDYAGFTPVHVIATFDYVINVGFDEEEVAQRVGRESVDEEIEGYQLSMTLGWSEVDNRQAWQVSFGYRYLERDAVLDAFTDSDFRLGGTDVKGTFLKFEKGLGKNTSVSLRWLSADEVTGEVIGNTDIEDRGFTEPTAINFGVDTLQLDLQTRF